MPLAISVALLSAAAPLIAAGTERWPGLAPCALCLWQRWPYWVAAGVALAAAFVPGRWRAWGLRVAALALLVTAGIAVLHLGVEWGWWPSPLPACDAPVAMPGASVEDILGSLPERPAKPCDEPAYLIPDLPLSMAAMNLIYALTLAGLTLRVAGRRE